MVCAILEGEADRDIVVSLQVISDSAQGLTVASVDVW